MLDVIIVQHAWSGQVRTHINTKIYTHQTKPRKLKEKKEQRKGRWVGKKERKEGEKKERD